MNKTGRENYRLYQIDNVGTITGISTDYDFAGDLAAMAGAPGLTLSNRVEVWHGVRFVGTVARTLAP